MKILKLKIKLAVLLILFVVFVAKSQSNFHKLFESNGQLNYLTMTTATNEDAVMTYHYKTGASTYLAIQRVDTAGNIIWAQAYQPTGNLFIPVNMCATPDSGVVIALEDSIQLNTIQIMKVNQVGGIEWVKSFNANYFVLYNVPILVLPDGNMLLTHGSEDSIFLKKIDVNGNLIWNKSYTTTGASIIRPGGITYNNSQIYIGGYDADSYSGFLVKIDSSGNIVWQKFNVGDIGVSLNVIPIVNGGVIVGTKSTELSGNGQPTKFACIDSTGGIKWTMKIPWPDAKIASIAPNRIDISSFDSSGVKLAIIDSTGTIQEVKSYHDLMLANSFSISSIADKGFLMSSISNSDIWLMKADTSGNTDCFMQADSLSTQSHGFIPSNYTLVSDTLSATFFNSLYTAQNLNVADSNLCAPTGISFANKISDDILIFPNPANETINISSTSFNSNEAIIILTNNLGKKIKEIRSTINQNKKLIIDCRKISNGIYFVEIISGKDRWINKVMINH